MPGRDRRLCKIAIKALVLSELYSLLLKSWTWYWLFFRLAVNLFYLLSYNPPWMRIQAVLLCKIVNCWNWVWCPRKIRPPPIQRYLSKCHTPTQHVHTFGLLLTRVLVSVSEHWNRNWHRQKQVIKITHCVNDETARNVSCLHPGLAQLVERLTVEDMFAGINWSLIRFRYPGNICAQQFLKMDTTCHWRNRNLLGFFLFL